MAGAMTVLKMNDTLNHNTATNLRRFSSSTLAVYLHKIHQILLDISSSQRLLGRANHLKPAIPETDA